MSKGLKITLAVIFVAQLLVTTFVAYKAERTAVEAQTAAYDARKVACYVATVLGGADFLQCMNADLSGV